MNRRQLTTVGPAVAWTILVIVLLSLPGRAVPESELLEFDKAAHVAMFTLGTFLWLRVPVRSRRARWLILLGALAFAPVSEWYQYLLGSGRAAEPMDAAADAIGVLVGLGVWLLWRRRTSKRTDRSHERGN